MDQATLQELASVAKIDLSAAELAALLPDFKAIVDSLTSLWQNDQLVDQPPLMPPNFSSSFRPDIVNDCSPALNEQLIAAAGRREGRFIAIPKLL